MPHLLAELAYTHAKSGDIDAAAQVLAEIQDAQRQGQYFDPYLKAVSRAGFDDVDSKAQTLRYLREAEQARSVWMPWIRTEPKFAHLADDPEFVAIVKDLGLD